MNEFIERYLDGELRLDELPVEVRAEAEQWSRALDDLTDDSAQSAPADLESQVMAEVMALPAHSPKPWLLRPRTVRFTPLSAGLLAAAALAGLLLLQHPVTPGGTSPQEVFVQFALEAPGANSVAVAGDFNAWEGEYELEDLDGDGIWTGRVLLSPGVHQYMFVIDGSDWVTDPNAERYTDDGFGNQNAIIAVESASPQVIS